MAQRKAAGGTQHKLLGGLYCHSAPANDKSRKISSSRSVDDEATRSGVAVGTSDSGKDKGSLK